jgi:ketosteroid isomerase-like protein
MLGTRSALATGALLFLSAAAARQAATPQSAVDELLAADRRFAAASATTDLVTGLSAMFAPDVVIGPNADNSFAFGHAAALEALRSNPANTGARLEWTPVRGGVSADGRHGFTFGFLTVLRADKTTIQGKYLSYWVKQGDQWRVAVYKRGRRPEGPALPATMPPALPPALVAPSLDSALIARYRQSLDSVERAFSAEAEVIGLGAAFAKYGSSDAINLGGPADTGFVVGSEAIGRAVSQGEIAKPSELTWAPERVIVASSGDLGVTIGTIRRRTPAAAGQPSSFPFFTIWRRATPKDPWRYVAE